MGKHRNAWTPDTCVGCTVEYEFDDAEPDTTRVHSFTKSIKSCPYHKEHHGKDAHFSSLLIENRFKNGAVEDLIEAFPEHLKEKRAILKGGASMKLEDAVAHGFAIDHIEDAPLHEDVSFSYDENRVLHLHSNKLQAAGKVADAHKHMTDKHGVGKIVID